MTELLTTFAHIAMGNIFVRLLLIAVCADMIFGSLRAIKFRKWNSACGIDGGIRKAGMLAAILLFTLVDMILPANLLGWFPENWQTAMGTYGVMKIGVTELFSILFILYEATSVLKNMLLCGIPIPAGIRKSLTQWLDTMTDETTDELKNQEDTVE